MLSAYRARFWKIAPVLATCGAALLSFKLNLAYIFLIPLLLGWIIFEGKEWFGKFFFLPESLKILAAFFIAATITSFVGLSPLHSAQNLIGLFFYPLLIPVFWKLGRQHSTQIITGLSAGLSAACLLNALRDSTLGIHTKFIGPVSQSGQLGIVLFLMGIFWFTRLPQVQNPSSECGQCPFKAPMVALGAACLIASILLIGWSAHWPTRENVASTGVGLLFGGIMLIWLALRGRLVALAPFTIFLPILCAALLVNLKRGPWLGVASGLVLLAFSTGKKRFFVPVILAALMALSAAPIRERIYLAKDHFFITGGRSEIWQIGFELLQKYPLGIGFENSGFLRDFSATIPHNLKHFHNNLLNVAVETGWIGVFLFTAFFYSLLRMFIAARHQVPVAPWIAAGIFSWFCAGFVEYNFGDSAVCNTLYIFIGLGLSQIAAYPSFQSQN